MESIDVEDRSMDIKGAKNIIEHSIIENKSTSKPANYDVFISHRGPDTKTGFVGYLYEALTKSGLLTFLDCKSIEMGDDAWRSIENAIKNSKIAVVVFSESFASSHWCLKELDAILGTPGLDVRMIFYKVRPSEVGRPESGKLKTAFEKLSKRHQKTEIEHWKKRLQEASKCMGWELPCNLRRLEADFLSDIVENILACANKPLPLDVGECAVGVKQVAEELVQILENKKEVLMLGLWGMGGIGKSTLARELYNQMKSKYDSSCFIEDVSEMVHHGGIKAIQQQIIKDLCKNDPSDINGKSKGKSILKERLSKIRFLLVLDDIQEKDVMEHCVLSEMFTNGSLCIVTSRDSSILKITPSLKRGCVEGDVYIHDVHRLNMVNSKEVLKFHAFGGCWRIDSEDEKLVSSISEGCGGVPLVLKVIGALLRGKEEKIWIEMVEKLSVGAIMDEKMLFECLRMSYDSLSREYQEIFLDIACALIGERKDYAMHIWKFGEGRIQNLVAKALVTVDEEGFLRMHDHLRDMGREIERTNKERRRMWMPEALTLLRKKKCLPSSLQALNLSFGSGDMDIDKDCKIDLDVSHMTDLRILTCNEQWILSNFPGSTQWFSFIGKKPGIEVNIPSIPEYNELTSLVLKHVKVHGLLSSMIELGRLKVLDLDCWEYQLLDWKVWNFPSKFGELNNLEVLRINLGMNLTMLPESFGGLKKLHDLQLSKLGIRSLPNTFGDLSELKVLNMSSCKFLTMLPNSFGGLKNLHHLKLKKTGLLRLPNTFGELSELMVLDMSSCNNLTMLPDSFRGLKKLHHLELFESGIRSLPNKFGELRELKLLNLSWCKDLTTLPNSFGGLKKLHDLQLFRTGLRSLPKTFGELRELKVLDMSSCQFLTMLPESFGGLMKLHELQISGSGIMSLPNTFGDLRELKVLNMSSCHFLTMLSDSFGGLKKLHHLQLTGSGIRSLPNTFGDLSELKVLNMSWCNDLTMLPDSFGGLKKLHHLQLFNSGIRSLPNTFGELRELKVFDMSSCEFLTMLPDSFGALKKLHDLQLSKSGIRSLPNTFGELSELKVLNMSSCQFLTMLPDSFGGLKNLHLLNLKSTGILRLPNTFGELSKLTVLDMSSCKYLTMLPDSFGSLKKLYDLQLSFSDIRSISNRFGELNELSMLNMSSCKNLSMLPDSFGGLEKLHHLQLTGSGIRSLPNTFGDLSELKVLNMSWCNDLTMLPDSFGGLKKLHHLQLFNSGVRSLPNSFGDLSELKVLNMSSCHDLTMLPDSFGGLKKLHDLQLSNSGIRCLPNSFGNLTELKVLSMSRCHSLTLLPDSFGGLKKLHDLELSQSGIRSLPNTFGELSELKMLNMSCCEYFTMLPDFFKGLKKLHDLQLYGSGTRRLELYGSLNTFGELSDWNFMAP